MQNSFPLSGVLLVSDMDGTLITKDFEVPGRNIEAVKRFTQKGGLFSLATGRSEKSAARYIDKVAVNAPSIVCNGSGIFDFLKDQYVWSAYLPTQAGEILKKAIERFPDVGAEIYCEGQIYIINENEWARRHKQDESLDFIAEDVSNVPFPWNKALFTADNEKLLEVQAFIEAQENAGWEFVFGNSMYYEMLPLGANKGKTLNILAQKLGISHENVYAIGDYFNDLELVVRAGFGAVPCEAPPELQKQANLVVGRCEEGAVADLIEYIEQKFDCR